MGYKIGVSNQSMDQSSCQNRSSASLYKIWISIDKPVNYVECTQFVGSMRTFDLLSKLGNELSFEVYLGHSYMCKPTNDIYLLFNINPLTVTNSWSVWEMCHPY